jgi:hypothetical protein
LSSPNFGFRTRMNNKGKKAQRGIAAAKRA